MAAAASVLIKGAEILEVMSRLELFAMRAVCDEVTAKGIKRRHEALRVVGPARLR